MIVYVLPRSLSVRLEAGCDTGGADQTPGAIRTCTAADFDANSHETVSAVLHIKNHDFNGWSGCILVSRHVTRRGVTAIWTTQQHEDAGKKDSRERSPVGKRPDWPSDHAAITLPRAQMRHLVNTQRSKAPCATPTDPVFEAVPGFGR
jgi:hypothetical protein